MKINLKIVFITFVLSFCMGMLFSANVNVPANVQDMVMLSVSDRPIDSMAASYPGIIKNLKLPDSSEQANAYVNVLSNTAKGYSITFAVWTSFPLMVRWGLQSSSLNNYRMFTSAENGTEYLFLDVYQRSLVNKAISVAVNAVDDRWYEKDSGRYGMTMSFWLEAR